MVVTPKLLLQEVEQIAQALRVAERETVLVVQWRLDRQEAAERIEFCKRQRQKSQEEDTRKHN